MGIIDKLSKAYENFTPKSTQIAILKREIVELEAEIQNSEHDLLIKHQTLEEKRERYFKLGGKRT